MALLCLFFFGAQSLAQLTQQNTTSTSGSTFTFYPNTTTSGLGLTSGATPNIFAADSQISTSSAITDTSPRESLLSASSSVISISSSSSGSAASSASTSLLSASTAQGASANSLATASTTTAVGDYILLGLGISTSNNSAPSTSSNSTATTLDATLLTSSTSTVTSRGGFLFVPNNSTAFASATLLVNEVAQTNPTTFTKNATTNRTDDAVAATYAFLPSGDAGLNGSATGISYVNASTAITQFANTGISTSLPTACVNGTQWMDSQGFVYNMVCGMTSNGTILQVSTMTDANYTACALLCDLDERCFYFEVYPLANGTYACTSRDSIDILSNTMTPGYVSGIFTGEQAITLGGGLASDCTNPLTTVHMFAGSRLASEIGSFYASPGSTLATLDFRPQGAQSYNRILTSEIEMTVTVDAFPSCITTWASWASASAAWLASPGYASYDTKVFDRAWVSVTPNFNATPYTTLCDGWPRVSGTDGFLTTTEHRYETITLSTSTITPFPESPPPCSLNAAQCSEVWSSHWLCSRQYAKPPDCDTFAMSPPCPQPSNLARANLCANNIDYPCTWNGAVLQLYYWPVVTSGGNICDQANTPGRTVTGNTPRSAIVGNMTVTSPDVAFSISILSAYDNCGNVGEPMTDYVLTLPPTDVSSQLIPWFGVQALAGNATSFNFADLAPNPYQLPGGSH
ncbi:hypothetical protein BAUCODRAFT_20732 [Baudoinia panamericana UAMH 10762]|uniref:Apple domain-containing protein n=1 Tax=Baudoinia panamericana (strain UAMH 10762) TaxID=717646 RepID=M2NN72_BAUPA|nr:uncharacterized protein BAUCODRAFT_20732 [Baudoinia panamericana UAMH 10762]EMD00676.1 hypothetical protein BAUCODRAFT_20732 [Baudoinia panamericana UAMH 10762]